MTMATINVVNFDKAKENYVKNMGLSEIPKSSDAFFVAHACEMYLIEFRSGKIQTAQPAPK
ncbi:MAG: hypothetical protein FWE28_03895 [Oscillospiraceae bacterium]|nr:hypothetical protein [Oscillospiraceae bacterium]